MGRKFSYIDMMRTTPAKAVYNKQVEKHSEMLKPYKHDGYQEMEHFYPDYNWNWDFDFNFPLPGDRSDGVFDGLPPDLPKREDTCVEFDCFYYRHFIIWECNEQRTIRAKMFDKFADISYEGPISIASWNSKKINLVEATIVGGKYGTLGEHGKIKMKFTPDSITFPCECLMLVLVPDGCRECDCDAVSTVSIDDTSTPDTIAAGNNVTVYVQDGCAPYTWAITTGSGYSLGSLSTEGLTNTLSCVSGVCGVDFSALVTVQVTDACGNSDTVTLRNTSGSWSVVGSLYTATNNCANNTVAECDVGVDPELIIGQYKWTLEPFTKNTVSADCSCALDSANWDASWTDPTGVAPPYTPYAFWKLVMYPYGSACDCDETQVVDQVKGSKYEWNC